LSAECEVCGKRRNIDLIVYDDDEGKMTCMDCNEPDDFGMMSSRFLMFLMLTRK
jgi:hypothetical protein